MGDTSFIVHLPSYVCNASIHPSIHPSIHFDVLHPSLVFTSVFGLEKRKQEMGKGGWALRYDRSKERTMEWEYRKVPRPPDPKWTIIQVHPDAHHVVSCTCTTTSRMGTRKHHVESNETMEGTVQVGWEHQMHTYAIWIRTSQGTVEEETRPYVAEHLRRIHHHR